MNRREVFMTTLAGGAAAALSSVATGAKQRTFASSTNWVRTHDGCQLYVRSWGEGEPIIFLAGWALPSEIWSYQMAALSERGFRCIAYDRRGHGRSDDPGRGYDYETLASDLGAVLSALDVRNGTIVAHSMGGGEVLTYLGRSTNRRVARVLFLATTLPCLLAKPDNPGALDAAVVRDLRRPFYVDFPGWIELNSEPFVVQETSALMRSWIKNTMLQTSLRAVIDLHRTMVEADFREPLRRVSLPMLFIHGDKDMSAPLALTASRACSLARGSELIVYRGAPHGLFVTHSQKLNGDIEAFARA